LWPDNHLKDTQYVRYVGSMGMRRIPEARFTLRELCKKDVAECLSFNSEGVGQEIIGPAATMAVWRSLIGNRAFRSNVVEASEPSLESRLAGFGARMFVTPDFVDAEISNPKPGLKARLIAGIHHSQDFLLGLSEIRHRNTHTGLDMVLFDGWRPGMLSEEAASQAYARLSFGFFALHSGLWIKRMITDVKSEAARDWYLATRTWRVISDFETFYAQNPGVPRVPGHSLLLITADDTRAVTGHGITTMFHRKTPELCLRNGDQQFLEIALEGLTDDELARKLGISSSSVKKRWLFLFESVAAIRPEIFPDAKDSPNRTVRGRQKRHLLLAYIRTHPEELAPYEWL
jgi:hypothetical protein